jgi:hypothetical protein
MNQGENNQKKFNINPDSGEVNQQVDDTPSTVFEENGTFCRIGSTSGGFLEIDLRSMRQKGKEDRYISFNVVGFGEDNQVASAEMLLLDEELFKKLKAFIEKLNWNE